MMTSMYGVLNSENMINAVSFPKLPNKLCLHLAVGLFLLNSRYFNKIRTKTHVFLNLLYACIYLQQVFLFSLIYILCQKRRKTFLKQKKRKKETSSSS